MVESREHTEQAVRVLIDAIFRVQNVHPEATPERVTTALALVIGETLDAMEAVDPYPYLRPVS